ncbi:MAG: hypothetical protein PUB46_04860 [Lachnospiraceae bacterium]|uniref:hypothetical protein n=1 Tax=Roseburia hominis TaxID=301301 RepID=UPI001F4712D8|nr:hypothetical protein [Roseburia hominis]MDD6169395.1 hypothetical protein [Lachnospiraceae bacterium]MDY4840598.1 hypothetical protein [Lachnospiraceae bacterium]
MKIQEFINTFQTQFTQFCPCVITEDGEVIECRLGHTEALLAIYEKKYPEENVPKEVVPMQYLIVRLHAVVVDYENQVYSDSLNTAQKEALSCLADSGMIEMHLANIHGKY